MNLRLLSLPVTSRLLGSFEPRPDRGDILFSTFDLFQAPASPASDDKFETLTSWSTQRLYQLGSALFEDAERIYGEHSGSLPIPLKATGAEWSLQELDEPLKRFVLSHSDGRFLRFNLRQDVFMKRLGSVVVGMPANNKCVSLINVLETKEITTRYQFLFEADGVKRLRSLIGVPLESPLYELGLAISALIYTSGQYPELRKFYILNSRGREVGPPGEFFLSEDGSIEMSEEIQHNCEQARYFRIHGLRDDWNSAPRLGSSPLSCFVLIGNTDGVNERLSISLDPPDKFGTNPLKPALKERLWDVAEILLSSPKVIPSGN